MGYLYQVGKTYYFGVRVNGKWIRQSARTRYKEAAQAKLKEAEIRVAQGKPLVDPPPPPPMQTFQSFAEEYLAHKAGIGYDALRDKYCIGHFTRVHGAKPLNEITREDVERYVALRLSEKAAPPSVQREIGVVKAAFNQALKWDRVEKNPATRVGVKGGSKPRERLLTPEEIERLIAACTGSLKDLVETALFTGMRKGEMLQLTERDCDFLREEIHIRESKNGDPRTIPMHPRVKEILWSLARGIETRRLFDVGPGFHYGLTKAVERAGIRDFRFHDLRHCASSYLFMAGADARSVMQILGHRDPRITLRIYTRVSQGHMREAVHRLRFNSQITHSHPQEAHQAPVTS